MGQGGSKQRASAESRLSKSCHFCRGFENDERETSPTLLEDIRQSANDGCPTCSLLQSGIDACITQREDIEMIQFKRYWINRRAIPPKEDDDGLLVGRSVSLLKKDNDRFFETVTFFGAKASPWQAWQFPCPGLPAGDLLSKQSMLQVISWIRTCTSQHSCCDKGPFPILPSRVLDVGGSNIKVLEAQDRAARYVCLSHSWGTGYMTRTTKSNLRKYKESVPWSALTKTFQDAIEITRRLQIRFLWIDSLCIIQDDEADWARESSKMAEIYSHAYLTLAATGATMSDPGLFNPSIRPHFLDGTHTKTWNCDTILVRAGLEFNSTGSSDTLYRLNTLPLLLRGWVLQERWLSQRVLHFTKGELVWECANHTAYEPEILGLVQYTPERSWKRIHSLQNNNGTSIWHSLIGLYSGMALTHPSDRLPAISGIAKFMQKHIAGRYLARLWEATFINDLGWTRASANLPQRARPSTWLAPSWSWASIEDRVHYLNSPTSEYGKVAAYCAVRAVSTVPETADPTGRILTASLQISGTTIPVSLSHSSATAMGCDAHSVSFDYAFPGFYGDDDNAHRELEGDFYALLLYADQVGGEQVSLLLRTVNAKEKVYERIGQASWNVWAKMYTDEEGWFEPARHVETTVIHII